MTKLFRDKIKATAISYQLASEIGYKQARGEFSGPYDINGSWPTVAQTNMQAEYAADYSAYSRINLFLLIDGDLY